MANKEIIVKDNVDIVIYTTAVNEIVDKFFSEGDYTPHFGRINSVGVFFNYFVNLESIDDYLNDANNTFDLDYILSNDEYMALYNTALNGDGSYKLNFANAFSDAMDIVKQRNASFSGVIDNIKNAAAFIYDKISPTFTGENIERLSEIAKDVSNGNLSAESIVSAYGNSQRIKDITKKD